MGTKSITRRNFLKSCAAVGAAAMFATTATGCGVAASDKVKVLRLANPMATGDNITLGYDKLAEIVAEKSGGAMRIDHYANAVLGSDRVTTEAVQEGTLDMASCSSPNFSGFIPEFGAFDLPYVTDKQYQQNLYDAIDYGELGKYYDEVTSQRGLKLLMYTEYGYRNFAMAKKQIKSVADMDGTKIRTTDSKVEVGVVRALNAQAMPVAWGQTFTALTQGTVDGEGNTWSLLLSAKHNEALKYGIESRHNYSMHILTMGTGTWNKLTDNEKQILTDACHEALVWQRAICFDNEAKNKQKMIDAGTNIYDPTEAELQEFKDITRPVWDSFVGKTIPQECVDMIRATQSDDYQLLGASEEASK